MTKQERIDYLTILLESGLKFAEIKADETVKTWQLKDQTLRNYLNECRPIIEAKEEKQQPTPPKTEKPVEKQEKTASIERARIKAEDLANEIELLVREFHDRGIGITAMKVARQKCKEIAKILQARA